jgi:hypothetical protein
MVKVLIYSSKEIYDNASYEGRAEADVVAYAVDDYEYQVLKSKNSSLWMPFNKLEDLKRYGTVSKWKLVRHVECLENEEWEKDKCQTRENI